MCAPQLSWLYDWSLPLTSKGVLRSPDQTRCMYDHSSKDGPLLLLMEYYTKLVTPACPVGDNCTCLLDHIQEGTVVSSGERVYGVQVSCVGQGLTHFPKLPLHTRTVDLSGNRVSEWGANDDIEELLLSFYYNFLQP